MSKQSNRSLVKRNVVGLVLAIGATLPLLACSRTAEPAETPQAKSANAEQAIVDSSAIAFEDMRKDPRFQTRANVILERARGVMIFPRLVKASALLGGEGGSGVLLARKPDGSWSDPAFYSVGSPSVGLQVGYQQATVVLFIMDQPTLERALHSSFTLGTKAGVTVGYVEENGKTKGNVISANVYQMVDADGIFAGVSLDGYVIGERSRHNLDYYGRRVTARDILLDGEAHNPAASSLTRVLAPTGS